MKNATPRPRGRKLARTVARSISGCGWPFSAKKQHPADALGVYQARLGPMVATGGASAYREGIELLDKIRVLFDRLGRGDEFAAYRDKVRAAHRQRRGFLKLLDASPR